MGVRIEGSIDRAIELLEELYGRSNFAEVKRVLLILKGVQRELEHPEAERIKDAIRDHRATKTPAEWSTADKRLYAYLEELQPDRMV